MGFVCVHGLSRFGSFEIFKPADEFTGRQGPSYGRDEIRGQMMDYVIEMFYPEIQQNYPDRVERNVAFFREVRQSMSYTVTCQRVETVKCCSKSKIVMYSRFS